MTHFMSDPTIQFNEAVDILRKLPLGDRMRAAAEAISPDLEREFQEIYGRKRKAWSWQWLVRKKQNAYDAPRLPGSDHEVYRESGGKRSIVSQPYHMDWDAIRSLVEVCEEHGLRFDIDGTSAYFPGRTMTVIIRAANAA